MQVSAEAKKLADEILSAKQTWTAGNLTSNEIMKSNAVNQANQARDRLRALGYGTLADQLSSAGANLMQSLQLVNGLSVAPVNSAPPPVNTRVANPSVSPTTGGAPVTSGKVDVGLSSTATAGISQAITGGQRLGGTGQTVTPANTGSAPQFVVVGVPPAAQNPPAQPAENSGWFGQVTAGVTNTISKIAGGIDVGLQAGAGGAGAAAGGLAETIKQILSPLAMIATPILLIWAGAKIFKINAKIGGR